ncbi:MAG: Triose-phosphate Transporter [Chrysothrix sp. TS-e1954]|nr:MAG: Triose-phosphate Transporter [Chrysothrix sp. TS-e1954]
MASSSQSSESRLSQTSAPPPYESLDNVEDTSIAGSQLLTSETLRQKDRSSRQSSDSKSSDLELGRLQTDAHLGDEEGLGLDDEENLLAHHRSRSNSARFAFSQADGAGIESEKLGKKAFVRKVVVNGTLISSWYIFSVCISVYNKWMFAGENLNFHFPLFTTSLHMVVQFLLAFLVLLIFPTLRPRLDSLEKKGTASSSTDPQDEAQKSSKPLMTIQYYLTHVAPCGAATGLDIGLGNTSLRFITLVFFTMCKSSTLGFVLLFAILFRLEKPSWKLAGIIVIMSAGVIMMVAGETKFNALGFALLMMASFFSGLRWSLTQILLKRNPATSNPFSSLFFLTPVMFLILIIIAIPVEGFGPLATGLSQLSDSKGAPLAALILLTPGVIAFLMVSSEFALLQRTSVVTLSVCGIFKEVITIAAGGVIFGDELTPINISGLVVTIIAIAAYNYIRMTKMKRDEMRKVQDSSEEQAPMLSSDTPSDSHVVDESGRRIASGQIVRRSHSGSVDGTGGSVVKSSAVH